jgi:hypothetical protein
VPDENRMMTLEETENLFEFLTGGRPPAGITLGKRPRKMTAQQAFSLIYVLQEAFHVIPDSFEQCTHCGFIFDSESNGHSSGDGKFYCDYCSHHCKCSDCKAFRERN